MMFKDFYQKNKNGVDNTAHFLVGCLAGFMVQGVYYGLLVGLLIGLVAEYKEWSSSDTDKSLWQSVTTKGSLQDIGFYTLGGLLGAIT